jgi:Tfp pilus assembly protein PilF
MTTTTDTNFARLQRAFGPLTSGQANDAAHHLVGGLADNVDPERFESALSRAIVFATRNQEA